MLKYRACLAGAFILTGSVGVTQEVRQEIDYDRMSAASRANTYTVPIPDYLSLTYFIMRYPSAYSRYLELSDADDGILRAASAAEPQRRTVTGIRYTEQLGVLSCSSDVDTADPVDLAGRYALLIAQAHSATEEGHRTVIGRLSTDGQRAVESFIAQEWGDKTSHELDQYALGRAYPEGYREDFKSYCDIYLDGGNRFVVPTAAESGGGETQSSSGDTVGFGTN